MTYIQGRLYRKVLFFCGEEQEVVDELEEEVEKRYEDWN